MDFIFLTSFFGVFLFSFNVISIHPNYYFYFVCVFSSGWYDRKNIGEFRTIVDVNFVGAMGPPGGGRNPVTLRLLRHFHYLAFTELETSSKVCYLGNETLTNSRLMET